MKILCGFKYELYVDDALRSALSRSAGCRRFVFNKALALQNERKQAGRQEAVDLQRNGCRARPLEEGR